MVVLSPQLISPFPVTFWNGVHVPRYIFYLFKSLLGCLCFPCFCLSCASILYFNCDFIIYLLFVVQVLLHYFSPYSSKFSHTVTDFLLSFAEGWSCWWCRNDKEGLPSASFSVSYPQGKRAPGKKSRFARAATLGDKKQHLGKESKKSRLFYLSVKGSWELTHWGSGFHVREEK